GLIPVTAATDDVADFAALDSFQAFEVAILMSSLRAGDNVQVLFVGFLIGGQHFANAWCIRPHGLFRKDILASGHGRFQVAGPEGKTFSAAPLPRPPQPIRPTLMASLPAA